MAPRRKFITRIKRVLKLVKKQLGKSKISSHPSVGTTEAPSAVQVRPPSASSASALVSARGIAVQVGILTQDVADRAGNADLPATKLATPPSLQVETAAPAPPNPRHDTVSSSPSPSSYSSPSSTSSLASPSPSPPPATVLDPTEVSSSSSQTPVSNAPSTSTAQTRPPDSIPHSQAQGRAPSPTQMAEQELRSVLDQLHAQMRRNSFGSAASLLSRAKLALLKLNALLPSTSTPGVHLALARETLELGALISIRLQDPEQFTRYFQQLQPFYALPSERLPAQSGNASKLTGLYLLLLLSQGDYLSFHMLLESLELAAAQNQMRQGGAGNTLVDDEYIQYPVRLEQALMEGSYDRVWGETKRERVPGEEFAVFSEVLIGTIRAEIASCSEKAYGSVPISNAKNLFFLESEGAVIQFSQQRGWTVKDGRIWFPRQEQDLHASEKDILSTSGQVIENTLGYARELETIV